MSFCTSYLTKCIVPPHNEMDYCESAHHLSITSNNNLAGCNYLYFSCKNGIGLLLCLYMISNMSLAVVEKILSLLLCFSISFQICTNCTENGYTPNTTTQHKFSILCHYISSYFSFNENFHESFLWTQQTDDSSSHMLFLCSFFNHCNINASTVILNPSRPNRFCVHLGTQMSVTTEAHTHSHTDR